MKPSLPAVVSFPARIAPGPFVEPHSFPPNRTIRGPRTNSTAAVVGRMEDDEDATVMPVRMGKRCRTAGIPAAQGVTEEAPGTFVSAPFRGNSS
jgi:hypothetical protein